MGVDRPTGMKHSNGLDSAALGEHAQGGGITEVRDRQRHAIDSYVAT